MKKINIGLLVGIALAAMVGISAIAMSGIVSGSSKYTTFNEARKSGQNVHVVGKWVKREESSYDSGTDQFRFFLQDSTNTISAVTYHEPKPVNFETAEKIVIQGQYKGDVFEAERIFMKCPSKYNADEMDPEMAGQSVH